CARLAPRLRRRRRDAPAGRPGARDPRGNRFEPRSPRVVPGSRGPSSGVARQRRVRRGAARSVPSRRGTRVRSAARGGAVRRRRHAPPSPPYGRTAARAPPSGGLNTTRGGSGVRRADVDGVLLALGAARARPFSRVRAGQLHPHMAALEEQLTKYLTDVHSIEQQALAQMRVAPELAEDPQIAEAFSRHCHETIEHERAVRERLEARGAKPAVLKDMLGTLTGKGFTMFARAQPDTPGKLVVHAFSYEHMELAAHEMLTHVAELAGDAETVAAAREIGAQEDAMAARLAGLFDRAVDASLREVAHDELADRL